MYYYIATLKCFILLLGLMTNVKAKSLTDESTNHDYQDSMSSLVSRLGSSVNNSSENLVFMPPAFSVDIVSLLRWTIETQLNHNPQGRRSSRNANNNATSTENYYPTSFLHLVEFADKNYFFSKNQRFSFAESIAFCRAFGMDLVSVETKEEDEFLIQELDRIGLTAQYVWISANKIGRSSFLWINGEQLIYENWAGGNPAAPATEHCVIYANKKWHDCPCNNNPNHSYDNFFICEER